MASVASQLIEEVTAHAQRNILEDAREICADGTYFPNNVRTPIIWSALFLIITIQNLRNYSRQSPLTICSQDYSITDIYIRPKLSFSIKWLIEKNEVPLQFKLLMVQ